MNRKYTFENLPLLIKELKEEVLGLKSIIEECRIPNEEKKELLNIDEVSELLSLSKSTIYTKVSRRELPFIKQSKRLYFEKSEILSCLHSSRKPTLGELNEDVHSYLRGGNNE